MSPKSVRRWSILHTWSSIACTLFLLILCVTGLPLIFHEEIDAAFAPASGPVQSQKSQSINALVNAARNAEPGHVVQFIVWEPQSPHSVTFSMAESATAYPDNNVSVVIDTITGRPVNNASAGITEWLLKLHGQLLLGELGPPVLGLVALAFLLSLISGIVLYAPFMRRLPFGSIRQQNSHTRRLDWHNFLGITIAAWLLVVGGTGWVNSWGNYVFQIWQVSVMAPTPDDMDVPLPKAAPQTIIAAAQSSLPGLRPAIIAYPGSLMADPDHFAVYLRGTTPLESRLMQAALVNAETGEVSSIPQVPWFITGLLLSQPLHFGDYGGLPLKILWALFDGLAIIILWTGIRLWWRKRAA